MTLKVDSKVLNKLVSDFNAQMKICEEFDKTEGLPKENLVSELAKAMGLMTSISYESAALASDIAREVKIKSCPNINEEPENVFDIFSNVPVKPENNN